MKQLSDCRLLLVDDAKPNLDILVEGLKGDHKLSLALNGDMALQIAARTPPDLVLLDIMMPGLDGYEVCRRLRQMPETADVPIIFLSSLEDVQNKSRGFEVGANDYVTKPFDLLEVKARVRALLKAKLYSDSVKEQLAADLRVAREIQMGMIPQEFSALEKTFAVELSAVLEPAREVGGDLYSAFAGVAGRLVLFIGDVSGKGIPASLFMVRASSLARLLGRDIAEPERILARLNDELSSDNPSGMFVTMLCAVYDPNTGRIAMANAGHNRPVLLRPGASPRWAVERLGTALGFDAGLTFERTDLTLQPGDSLVLYTDGVNEAFNPQAECYGNERLLHDLGLFAQQPTPALPPGLLQNVRAHANGAPQSDDIAILVLRQAGIAVDTKSGPRTLKLELNATPEEVMRGVERLQAFGRQHHVDEKSIFGLALALEECGANIVHHACRDQAQEQFCVEFEHSAETLAIELRDHGPAFDPTTAVARALDATDDDRSPGGWGIHLIRHYMDEIRYQRDGDENVLRLVKRLPPRSS
ncbi:MAG: SpoIIE family protein phosphatase [Opitutaceae bacterium]|nr:SpoIIE family protein phosphatase [Verrucomicrobiales bacterium]